MRHKTLRFIGSWLLAIATVALILLVFAGVVWAVLELPGRIELNRQLASLRRANEPLTFAEFVSTSSQTTLDVSDAAVQVLLDCATPLSRAFDQPHTRSWRAFSGRHSTLPPLPNWGQPWPYELVIQLSEFLDRHAALIDEIDEIGLLPRGTLPRFSKRTADETTRKTCSRVNISAYYAAKLEAIAAVYAAAFEDSDTALLHCLSIFDIAARSDTSSREAWTTPSEYELGLGTLERVLSLVADPDPEVLNSFVAMLHALEQRSSFRDELILIRFAVMESHESVLKKGPPISITMTGRGCIREPLWEPRINWLLGGAIRSSEAHGIQWINEIIASADSPPRAISAAEDVAARTKSLRPDASWTEYVSGVMLSFLDILPVHIRRMARRIADLRCTRTALAAERFRIENGEWPASLDALVPEYLDAVPLDPFDEKPLRYKIEPDKITVYSIHENRIDDDGTINDSQAWSTRYPDVGFRLLNPNLRSPEITLCEQPQN